MRQGQGNTFNFLLYKNSKCKKTHRLLLKKKWRWASFYDLKSLQIPLKLLIEINKITKILFLHVVRDKMRIKREIKNFTYNALYVFIYSSLSLLLRRELRKTFLYIMSVSSTTLRLPSLDSIISFFSVEQDPDLSNEAHLRLQKLGLVDLLCPMKLLEVARIYSYRLAMGDIG